MKLLIKNINVIPINQNTTLHNMDLMIEGETITKISKTDTNINFGDEVIDGTDKYIMPGLWDNHAHIFDGEYLPLFLANGITTIRDLGNTTDYVFELRDKIKNKKLQAPDLFICGPILEGNPPFWGDSFKIIKNENEGKKAVNELSKKNVDFIKVYGTLPKKIFTEIVKESNNKNLKVTGHVSKEINSIEAIQLGQTGIEHLDNIFTAWNESSLARVILVKTDIKDNDGDWFWQKASSIEFDEIKFKSLLKIMKEKSIFFTPTLIQEEMTGRLNEYSDLLKDDNLKYIEKSFYENEWKPDKYDLWYENLFFIYKNQSRKLKELAENSILLAGSDTPNPFVIPGISLHEELELMSKAGISNYEVIKAATINGAKFVDKDESIGTVEVGKIANLLILGSNPLKDIKNTRDICAVILHGKYISKKELDSEVKIYK
jgi:imidazolonepropionase-like amidohydrolase